jgi:hypothetical protein
MKYPFQVAAAFGIGLIAASGATLAQSYGRGRNVQFVDGATISPTSVQASGTADQFVCTSTTATCEVESSASATTMTATVPAFDIGPTATPGANDRLACFSYGATGSKTRLACVDAEGDVATTGSFNSSVASGNQAYTCTNTGCRLSLGNTARYFVDDGTNLEAVAPLQATSVEALTTSGSSFSGGNSSTGMLLTSNATDSVTSSTVAAFTMQSSVDINNGDLLLALKNSAGTNVIKFFENGEVSATNQISTDSQIITGLGNVAATGSSTTLSLSSSRTSGTSVQARSIVNLTADTDRVFAVVNNTSTEIAHFSKDGLLRVNANNAAKPTCNSDNRGRIYYLNNTGSGNDTAEICMAVGTSYAWQPYAFADANASFNSCNATATSGSSFTGGNATGNLTITSAATDSVTSSTVPAIRLQASQNINNSDLILSVEDSVGTRIFTINEAGVVTIASSLVPGDISRINNIGYFLQSSSDITIADNGGGTAAAYTWQPSFGKASTLFTCNDADGCDITLSETSIGNGVHHRAINVSANNITFTDTAGVTEMAGNFTCGQWDTIEFVYVTDRFVEIGRVNN